MHSDLYKGFNALSQDIHVINMNLYQGFNGLNETMHKEFDATNKNIYNGFKTTNNNIASGFGIITKHMQAGFEAIIKNQELFFNLLCEGFQIIDFKLYGQSIALFKIDEKVQQILSQLQQLEIKYDERDRKKLYQLVERFEAETNLTTLLKILQLIQTQLSLSAISFNKLTNQGNNLSGWYYLQSFEELFKQEKFQRYNIDLKNVINFQWAELAIESYVQIAPSLTQQDYKNNHVVQRINNVISADIAKYTKETAKFIKVISSQAFLQQFFNYYQDKIDVIKTDAEKFLNYLQAYSKAGMQRYARDVIAQNQRPEIIDFKDILKSIKDNSQAMLSQFGNNSLRILENKIAEYNHYIDLFKFQSNILSSILDLEAEQVNNITVELAKLIPIQIGYYLSKGIAETKFDPDIPHHPSYYYLNINTDSKFIKCEISLEETKKLHKDGLPYSSFLTEYLEMFTLFATYNSCSDTLVSPHLNNP